MTAPAAVVDITEAMLYTDMGNFLTLLYGTDAGAPEVIRGQGNRTASPPVTTSTDTADAAGFIILQFFAGKRTTTNQHTFNSTAQTQAVQSNTQGRFQLDFYGKVSEDWARIFITLFRDQFGCANLVVCQPLWADEAIQAALVDGEEQWEERWMVEAYIQFNPTVTAPQQSALALSVKVINVDVTYPP